MNPLSKEERYATAITILVSLGYDVTSISQQHEMKLLSGIRLPSEDDLRFPLDVPPSWAEHFSSAKNAVFRTQSGLVHNAVEDAIVDATTNVPVLSTNTLRMGARLRLTAGQRAILRERYGMTPTRVVEVIQLELFPNTKYVMSLALRCDLHVPEHQRKHVLYKCTIDDFGYWMTTALERDRELQDQKTLSDPKKPTTLSAKTTTVKSPDQLLNEYLL